MELKPGIRGRCEVTADSTNSARAMGSGILEVFSTPSMIALMEKTACISVEPYLEEGCGTVGTEVSITHDAPTPLGMKVYCTSELIEVEGRRLVFAVEAFDETGRIGGGRHSRFIIRNDAFQKKTNAKLTVGQ